MPKRHPVEPLVPSGEILGPIAKHIYEQIALSLANLTPAEAEVAKKLFCSMVPEDYKLKEHETAEFVGKGYAILSLQAFFYRPNVPCTKRHRFDAPCDYEVLIPYLRCDQRSITHWIVPAGARPGDTVVILIPPPIHYKTSPEQRKLYAPLTADLHDKKLAVERCREVAANFQKAIKENELIIERTAGYQYGVMEIPNEPLLRLRRYNIPLQCAYEMVNADVGDFIMYDGVAAWNTIRQSDQNNKTLSYTLKRKPINHTLATAMIAWFGWELYGASLRDKERLEVLEESMKVIGGKSEYCSPQALTLKKRCNEIFKKHMSAVRERVRLRSESLNRTAYVVRLK